MDLPVIAAPEHPALAPNVPDYAAAYAAFSWDDERARLDGLPGGGRNICQEAVERHARGELRAHVAIRWLGRRGARRDITYGELGELTARFASVLDGLGVGREERVFGLAGRIPELYVAALGTLRAGAVFCPLFSAFGPEPIAQRLELGGARVLVTTPTLYARKVAGLRERLPGLRHVLVACADGEEPPAGTLDLGALLEAADAARPVEPTAPEDWALLHFTSGTTGVPKGAQHVHEAVVVHQASARMALDLHPRDVYWCTADPGWVTGTSYGIIAPLCLGVTMVVDEAEFDAARWYEILERERVTVWYTAPTALRMLMRLGDEPLAGRDLSAVRFIASVGEPLNPEVVVWTNDAYGRPAHDNWWQTETGGIMIANLAGAEVRPGSMGRPLPGIEAAIVERGARGVRVVEEPGVEGELALRAGWPSMFRGYLGRPERYAQAFAGDWYLTGDLAERDADGWFWFVGRADDVIKTAGHLIGPFEVESVLLEHDAVAEAGVYGVPDDIAGQVIHARVVLNPGVAWTPELQRELLGHARRRLGPAVAPRRIDASDALPRTRSGKIMRRVLRARELGEPEGDLSTLEEGAA
jgi:acetyl-CoA synthetase